jgi:tRNA(fMet)-specific endonuclease VapC
VAYLLDTSTLAEVLRAKPPATLVRRLSQTPTNQRWTSVVSVSQLLVAARVERKPKLMQEVVRLVAAIRVAPYDLAAAQAFAKFRAAGHAEALTDDVMIAAIAVSRDLVLVTRRTQTFSDFEGLRIENWTT